MGNVLRLMLEEQYNELALAVVVNKRLLVVEQYPQHPGGFLVYLHALRQQVGGRLVTNLRIACSHRIRLATWYLRRNILPLL